MAGQVHGNLSHAMRDNYAEHGVDEYYKKVAATYRNPFYPGIRKVVWAFLTRWWEAEGEGYGAGRALKVLDMAAGSGEATLCLQEWEAAGKRSTSQPSSPTKSPPRLPLQVQSTLPSRPAFIPPNARRGAQGTNGADGAATPRARVFSGGVPALPRGLVLDVVASDPYTSPAYFARTSRVCHPLSFSDLASGRLPPGYDADAAEPAWDMIVCSFALHLLTDPSELFALLDELSRRATWLVIIAPHKKPEIKETWGWSRWDIAAWAPAGDKLYGGAKREDDDETELEIVRDKVKLRLYRSQAI
ncbi:hypothetical protein Q8F55_000123 [Vanrija albida]|uniref:Methyltransferase domain-containing protein n=1 Tax=Vanrija albida TaxID=181172 RepID=A0ABR3QCE6_9TREE